MLKIPIVTNFRSSFHQFLGPALHATLRFFFHLKSDPRHPPLATSIVAVVSFMQPHRIWGWKSPLCVAPFKGSQHVDRKSFRVVGLH